MSDSRLHRLLSTTGETRPHRSRRYDSVVSRHVWTLLHLWPGGFPYLTVAGRHLKGWIVLDVDATVITAASREQGAAGTFKGTFGFHPLAAWLANTDECLAMELREGNADANTVADHLRVLDAALAQIPRSSQAKILVRVDGAGATHGLLKRLQALNTTRRTARYTVGWTITPEDERAVARSPKPPGKPPCDRTATSKRATPSPLTCGRLGVAQKRAQPGRPRKARQQAPRPHRRRGHPARGVADQRKPQRRHPVPAPARQGPRRGRCRRPAPAQARRAPGRPRLRPRQIPAPALGPRHPPGHRRTRPATRLRPGQGIFRYAVERTIAWLHGFRRLRIRWERRDDIHEAFLGLATCLITHRHVQRLC